MLGGVVGAVSGYYSGWRDTLLNVYVINAFMAMPGILLAIAFVAFLGPGLRNVILALTLSRMGQLRPPGEGAGDGRA